MDFHSFLKLAADLPVIETKLFLPMVADPGGFLVQTGRWEKAGRLIRAKRGVYLLAREYRKKEVFEPFPAALLSKSSYISLEKALEFHGLIAEGITVYTSITIRRPVTYDVDGVRFEYRHIQPSLFRGYKPETRSGQTGFIATPEKSLLDLLYLHRGPVSERYLDELRLQNTGIVNKEELPARAEAFDSH
jgi:hypothetical protein